MRFEQGNNLPRVKATNQSSILQMVYHCGPITRADIAKRLGLTLPTITTNISAMISAGLVEELDCPESSDRRHGRRSRLLNIVPGARRFVGVEMTGSESAVCLTDYRGQILGRRCAPAPSRDYEENLDMTCALLQALLEEQRLTLSDVDGLGFCVPGLVDSQTGVLKIRPSYNWYDKPILQDLGQRLDLQCPASLENNACARAYGASLFRRDLLSNTPTFAYLFIHAGIACPLILNTSSSFGSIVGAGEVGHMVMEPNGPRCTCGNRGCLEAISSDQAVIARCVDALARGGAPILRTLCSEGEEGEGKVSMPHILQAQREGDPDVCRVVERAVHTLGIAIANIDNFTCPHAMLIEGRLFQLEENRQRLLEVVHRNICNVKRTDTDFVFMEPDAFSGARGAAAVAVYHNLQLAAE